MTAASGGAASRGPPSPGDDGGGGSSKGDSRSGPACVLLKGATSSEFFHSFFSLVFCFLQRVLFLSVNEVQKK